MEACMAILFHRGITHLNREVCVEKPSNCQMSFCVGEDSRCYDEIREGPFGNLWCFTGVTDTDCNAKMEGGGQ